MAITFTTCPVCKQKLAIYDYMTVGSDIVCANCETNLRLEGRKPFKITKIDISETYNADSRPESYG